MSLFDPIFQFYFENIPVGNCQDIDSTFKIREKLRFSIAAFILCLCPSKFHLHPNQTV